MVKKSKLCVQLYVKRDASHWNVAPCSSVMIPNFPQVQTEYSFVYVVSVPIPNWRFYRSLFFFCHTLAHRVEAFPVWASWCHLAGFLWDSADSCTPGWLTLLLISPQLSQNTPLSLHGYTQDCRICTPVSFGSRSQPSNVSMHAQFFIYFFSPTFIHLVRNTGTQTELVCAVLLCHKESTQMNRLLSVRAGMGYGLDEWMDVYVHGRKSWWAVVTDWLDLSLSGWVEMRQLLFASQSAC